MSRKAKKPVRPSRLEINQRTFVKSKGDTIQSVQSRILTDLKTYDFYDRRDLIRAIAEHPNLPKNFSPIYGEGRAFHDVINLKNWISEESYPFWLLGMFNKHRGLLKEVLKAREKISSQILKGNAVSALQNLTLISKISESWWSIELAIHINKELLGNDTKGFIKHIQDIYPNLNLSGITNDLLLLSESNTAQLYVDTILGRQKEYRSSSIDGAVESGAIESCKLLPLYYDSSRTPSFESLFDYRTWSIIDQYMLFRNVFMELSVKGEIEPDWLSEITSLVNEIDDQEVANFISNQHEEDEFVSNIIEKYTCGEYQVVIQNIQNEVLNESRKSFGLLEIYARSKIYMATVGNEETFFDILANEFARILMLDPKSSERAGFLYKVSVKFRNEAWAKSLLYHLVSTQEWRNQGDVVEVLRKQTICLGRYNTPKGKNPKFRLRDIKFGEKFDIPEHRVLRHKNEVVSEVVLEPSIFPIYSDYLKTQSLYFIEENLLSNVFDFSIGEYLRNHVAFDFLPIRKLASLIAGLERGANFDYVSCLIIFDICGREGDSSFDEQKTELFEEYLEFSGTYQPSKMFQPDKIDSKVSYFLRNLCIPAQLDNIIQFGSNDEVIHERVAIIDLLIFARIGSIEELRAEKDKVLETLFSEKLRAKLEAGKLYVDVQALETHRRHVHVGLYEQAKSIQGGVGLEPLSEDGSTIDSRDLVQINKKSPRSHVLAVASSERSSILVRIFMQAVSDFALNENYGLDKYLSAEIRHIVFTTQLRSCFEKAELVTVQKNGKYLPNTYWAKKYNYVPPELIQELDFIFSEFSGEVDSILAKVNERFRVTVTESTSDNIFNFSPYHSRIVRISEIVNTSDSFESYFKALIGFMWELAIESARSAQQLINDVLLVELIEAVDRLEEDVTTEKGNFAMVDLMQSIRNSRTEFKKEIELVLNWFRFVGSEDVQTYERLGVVIEAAVSSFQSMFKHKGKDLVFTQEKTDLILNYSEARALFISLFTALENALKYGASGTPVVIQHQAVATVNRLTISNQIGDEIQDAELFIADTKAKWTNAYSNLSTAEGGSGLYKIHNLLTHASIGFNFDIEIRDSQFSALMSLNNEYFNNRR